MYACDRRVILMLHWIRVNNTHALTYIYPHKNRSMRIYHNVDQHNTMLCGLGMNFLSHANTHTAKHRMQKFQNVPNPLGKISLIRHFFSFPRHSAPIPNKTATRLSHSILCFCGIESGGIIFISSYFSCLIRYFQLHCVSVVSAWLPSLSLFVGKVKIIQNEFHEYSWAAAIG